MLAQPRVATTPSPTHAGEPLTWSAPSHPYALQGNVAAVQSTSSGFLIAGTLIMVLGSALWAALSYRTEEPPYGVLVGLSVAVVWMFLRDRGQLPEALKGGFWTIFVIVLFSLIWPLVRAARTKRHGVIGALALIAPFALASATIAAVDYLAQFRPVVIDPPVVERMIVSGIRDQSQVNVVVECPTSIERLPGDSFQCVATTLDRTTVLLIEVTVQNHEGEVFWQIKQ